MTPFSLCLIAGSSNPELSAKIARNLSTTLRQVELKRFSDGETYVRIGENVRGQDVFILQSTAPPVNDHLMELLILIDAAKRASASRITAVIPYFGYARQDRKAASREPITAKLVADLLSTAGADRVMTVDLHSGQIQGFFDIPVDNLLPDKLFARHLPNQTKSNLVVVAPDVGATKRAGHLAKDLGAELAIINKNRPRQNESEALHVIGEVNGKNCLLFDDIVDTAGTLCNAAESLRQNGAKSIHVVVSHALLSGKAVERLCAAPVETVFISDSISQKNELPARFRTVSFSELLAKAIERTHQNQSVSSLFE